MRRGRPTCDMYATGTWWKSSKVDGRERAGTSDAGRGKRRRAGGGSVECPFHGADAREGGWSELSCGGIEGGGVTVVKSGEGVSE